MTADTIPLRLEREPAPARPRHRDDSLPRGGRVGSWIVERELGRGGMASVHAVAHSKLGGRAAIKIAHRSIFTEAYTPTTFLREARVARKVEHPGVIEVFATGNHDGRPYLVVERLAGMPLGERVDAGPVPRLEALQVLIELCDILRAAHAAGIVHRDLKLDNVFLLHAPYADGKRVKLLDWGVAHVTGEDDPFRGLIAGTLVYVAPELVRGDVVTPAADVYSLAVLAYHLLCRRPPFAAVSDLALISMHLRIEPPRASIAWPEIPQALDDLLIRMLAKAPAERPALDEVERVLRGALDEVSPKAPPRPSLLARLTRTPPDDPFGRPIVPVPPFRPAWIGLALALAGMAAVLTAFS
ncbi:MAG: serine/threonine-protein kinase [Acidobacteriota bacterium]